MRCHQRTTLLDRAGAALVRRMSTSGPLLTSGDVELAYEALSLGEDDGGRPSGVFAEVRLPLLLQLHRRGLRISIEPQAGSAAPVRAVGDVPGDLSDVHRVLRTVLVTDLVDSTKRLATDGDHAWRDTIDGHDALVREQLSRFDGREVNTTGDGFLAVFDGPCRAIRCARAISEGVRDLGLRTRAGIHTGEIEARGPDVAGVAVHISARVAGLARADEVLVSSAVPPLVLGSDLAFRDRGEHHLKGLPGRWQVFAVC